MIKVNEYRLGIIVMDVEPYDKIYEVDINMLINAINGISYRPIPLTPEWLGRCGFEYLPFEKGISLFSFYKRSEFELIIVNEGIDCEYNQGVFYYSDERHPVKYLHQLQNLYFALTGEELKIKTD